MTLRVLLPLAILTLASGCTLIPKRVEYFQDRVRPVPERSAVADESLRQAARLAAQRAADTERAALATEAAPEVVAPARDTTVLTGAVAEHVGPPAAPWTGDINALIARMDAQEARYRARLDAYRDSVRPNVGKPIEGTGAIQVGYFTHLLILATIVAVAWVILKVVAITHAPVAIGMRTIEGGGRFLGRAFAEVVEGGEEFKARIRKRLASSPESLAAVLEEFQTAHRARQSRDVQGVVQKAS